MGQYYYPTILREKNKRFYSESFYSHDYDNGLKLTEHSWVGNNFVETVMTQLFNKPGRLAWLGDYHEKGDFAQINPGQPAILEQRFYEHYKCFCTPGCEEDCTGKHLRYYNRPEECRKRKGRFILNHDKQVYIDMVEYEKLAPKDSEGWCLHPVPLLTAVGNGRGGGDYCGPNYDSIGCWAGDLIETQMARPNGYRDVTEEVACYEDK